ASARKEKEAAGVELENRYYRLRVRDSDGAVLSLLDKQAGAELVDPTSPETRITLPNSEKRVEFTNVLDRTRMPYVVSLQPGQYYSFDFPVKFDSPAN